LDKIRESLTQLHRESEDPNLWNDQERAQKILKQVNDLQDELSGWEHLSARINDALELAKLNDESLRPELEKEISSLNLEVNQKDYQHFYQGK
jgi:peptide chain release factor 2